MKSVLISIKPKWCQMIASGKKTVEVRKTVPKLEPPFKCYIYCTQGEMLTYNEYCGYDMTDYREDFAANGKVIAEFVCSKICAVLAHPSIFAGKSMFFQYAVDAACLTQDEVEQYSGGKDVAGFVISDLKVYDKPKPLRRFHKPCPYKLPDGSRMDVPCPCDKYTHDFDEESGLIYCTRRIKRPPQSWCYVEELRNE